MTPADLPSVPEIISQLDQDARDLIYFQEKARIMKAQVKIITDAPIPFDSREPKKAIISFFDRQPVFFDENRIFWRWDKEIASWKICDETDILSQMDGIFRPVLENEVLDISQPALKARIVARVQIEGRKSIPKKLSSSQVQFGSSLLNVKTGEITKATPEFFATNSIPYELGESEDTPTIDKLFEEWVGPEEKAKLYEMFAYSCLPDYPIQIIFALIGAGNNGKTTCLNLLTRFLGEHNTSTVRLDALIQGGSRFESSSFYRKLVCLMGETNTGVMKNTSYLKELSGGGTVTVEFKGKNPFQYNNYAKIVIASNSLPPTTDKTIGMLRRWLIIDFPNNFEGREKRNVLAEIPETEYRNLAKKCARILQELLASGHFTNEGSIEERAKKFEEMTNPMKRFIPEYYESTLDDADLIPFSRLQDTFKTWAKREKVRIVGPRELRILLEAEGFEVGTAHAKVLTEGTEVDTTRRVVRGLKEKVSF